MRTAPVIVKIAAVVVAGNTAAARSTRMPRSWRRTSAGVVGLMLSSSPARRAADFDVDSDEPRLDEAQRVVPGGERELGVGVAVLDARCNRSGVLIVHVDGGARADVEYELVAHAAGDVDRDRLSRGLVVQRPRDESIDGLACFQRDVRHTRAQQVYRHAIDGGLIAIVRVRDLV